MSANMNPSTGYRYGIISADSLDPEIINEIQMHGIDLIYEENKKDLKAAVLSACEDYMSKSDAEDLADEACERMEYLNDEPIHSFNIECPGYGRVIGQTTWLGGALLVWIFDSPFVLPYAVCSPCVPNAGNLDCPDKDGVLTHDVPNDWRNHE